MNYCTGITYCLSSDIYGRGKNIVHLGVSHVLFSIPINLLLHEYLSLFYMLLAEIGIGTLKCIYRYYRERKNLVSSI